MSRFEPFGWVHLLAVAGVAAAALGVAVAGRAWRGTLAQRRLEWGLATCLWGLWVGYQVHGLLRYGFDWRWSLPLQLCDLVALGGALALVRGTRALHALTYFWGLALGSQALLTPDLSRGPDTLDFWAFWAYHAFVTAAAVYVVAVRGYRPHGRDLALAIALGVLYAATVGAIDAVFHLNYGYLGRPLPSQPSLLDHLGPWPVRIVFMVLLGAAAMTVLWLPWAWVAWRGRASTASR